MIRSADTVANESRFERSVLGSPPARTSFFEKTKLYSLREFSNLVRHGRICISASPTLLRAGGIPAPRSRQIRASVGMMLPYRGREWRLLPGDTRAARPSKPWRGRGRVSYRRARSERARARGARRAQGRQSPV